MEFLKKRVTALETEVKDLKSELVTQQEEHRGMLAGLFMKLASPELKQELHIFETRETIQEPNDAG